MFAAFLVFALVTAHATEIPSYIYICGRKDPNYDQCIANNLNSLREKICVGLPEFDILSMEPLIIDKLVVYDTENLKLSLKDLKVTKICDYVVNYVHADPVRLHIEFEMMFNHLTANAVYDFDIHILVSLANKGQCLITADNTPIKISMDLKVATKNGESQIYVSKINTNLNLTSFTYEFDESEKELVQLHQAIRSVVDSNKNDVIATVKPALEEKISKEIISLFNGITRSNFEKLFPD